MVGYPQTYQLNALVVSIQHALSCAKRGYPSIPHNELRDITASLLAETCHSVAIEPSLQPVTGETFTNASTNTKEGARLDIVASGFWRSSFERAFFDVRVFNPFAHSNSRAATIQATYRSHEKIKRHRTLLFHSSRLLINRQSWTSSYIFLRLTNGSSHTALQLDGYAVDFPLVYSAPR